MRARHTYVKLTGGSGPDPRLTAEVPRKSKVTRGMIGDTVRGNEAHFSARVLNGFDESKPVPLVLTVVKDGLPWRTETVTSDDHVLAFNATEHGRYRLQLTREPTIEAVSSPIWFEPLPPRPGKGCGDGNHAHARAGECKN